MNQIKTKIIQNIVNCVAYVISKKIKRSNLGLTQAPSRDPKSYKCPKDCCPESILGSGWFPLI